jgi:hypothetical protein
MITPINYGSVHFMVLPAPAFWISPLKGNFTISFSGIAFTRFHGSADGTYHKDTLQLSVQAMRMDKILERVHPLLSPLPAGTNAWAFVPLQWTINSAPVHFYDRDNTKDIGFSVEDFKIRRMLVRANEHDNHFISVLDGMDTGLAVRGTGAFIFEIEYGMEVYGYFVPYFIPPIY